MITCELHAHTWTGGEDVGDKRRGGRQCFWSPLYWEVPRHGILIRGDQDEVVCLIWLLFYWTLMWLLFYWNLYKFSPNPVLYILPAVGRPGHVLARVTASSGQTRMIP